LSAASEPIATGDGGRLISDTLHDNRGLQVQTRTAYPTAGEPGGDIVIVNNTDEVPRWERTVYDGAERPVHAISMSRGLEQWRVSTQYKGEQTLVTAPEGGVGTTTITDIRGNTTELRHHHGREPVGDYDEITYTYNHRNDLDTVTDSEGNTWTHTYDLRGRKVSTTDPDTGTTTFTYDELDRLATKTDARDETLAYVYDALGRTVSLHDDSPQGNKRAAWVYDTLAKGQLTSSTRYNNGNSYTTRVVAYDQLYRPVTSDVVIPAAETGVAGTYRFTTRYNPDGSIRSQLMPAVGGLDVENVSYTYNDLGQMTRVAGEGTYVEAAYYSSIGNLTQRSFSREGVRARKTWATWDYDEATNRVKWANVVPEVGNGSLLHQYYAYDDAGNILSIRDEPSDPNRLFDVQCYTYDERRQLSQVWTPDATGENACAADPNVADLGGAAPYWHTYTYDAIGNRVTETKHGIGGATNRSYTVPGAGQNQPHALTRVEEQGPAGGRLEEYAYDDSGNMVSRITASADQVMEWDAEGKLVTVGDADLGVTNYLYDAEGARLIRRSPATTTLYLPGAELHFDRQSLLRTALRYYQHAGETVAVRDSDGKVSWIFSDHHGTGQMAVDSATGEVTQRRFTAFGEDRGGGMGDWPDERGFVGGTVDESTGLTQLGARAYDAAIGRFISVDPVLDLTDPQQMHGYAYANNNPVTYSDPDGLKVRKFLTGLGNRRRANMLLDSLQPDDAVALCDLDHFKAVNDDYGHYTGDRVLVAFAQLLAGQLRPTDSVARYGGEEFLVILHQAGVEAAAAVERHQTAWRTLDPLTTFSAGVAIHQAGDPTHTTLAAADAALYHAKRTGRDKTCQYDADTAGSVAAPAVTSKPREGRAAAMLARGARRQDRSGARMAEPGHV
jgi:diguanylate cyclase (GGDEF)-like protein/RHS repeat-associated protein